MPEREFSVRAVVGDQEWRIIHHLRDGSVLDVAAVHWSVVLRHPNLTRERFERALCGDVLLQPNRTWRIEPEPGTFMAWLLHNGNKVGSISWVPGMSRKPDRLAWMEAIVDGLNEDRGHRDPFPEPMPPQSVRDRVWLPGDFDYATGKEIPAA